jgi:hypothetical protein
MLLRRAYIMQYIYSMAMFVVQPGRSFHSVQVGAAAAAEEAVRAGFQICRAPVLIAHNTWLSSDAWKLVLRHFFSGTLHTDQHLTACAVSVCLT